MTTNLTAAERGCLLLADITGYTAYLQGTELEHAQDVLADLLETIIASIEPPFTVSKLEGDAVFAYIASEEVDASVLFQTIDTAYFAFRRRLRDVVHSTTCDCNACVLIPSLDLKFFVHLGEYVVRRIGRNEELTGADVILVHRLMKGTAGEVVGGDAYAVLTRSVVDAMDMDSSDLKLLPHREVHDGADVDVFVRNLEEQWSAEQARTRTSVAPADALGTVAYTIAAPQPEVWAWHVEPRRRVEWQAGLTGVEEFVEGVRGEGTIHHCAHGKDVTIQRIVDWQPFDTYTTRDDIPDSPVVLTATIAFEPADDGTEVSLRFRVEPEQAWQRIGPELIPAIEENGRRLQRLLAGEEL